MKTKALLLICFIASQTLFAQGISVQGIARDNQKSAIADEDMTFTFEIQNESDGAVQYSEYQQIKTDPYGVFSHIIGTGTATGGTQFQNVQFMQTPMKLVIKVDYNGSNGLVISDRPFQHTPYAISANNGVPTGTIVPFAGVVQYIPPGWALCNGSAHGSTNLQAVLGSANTPNLQGMFLRGTGTSPVNGQAGPALRTMQGELFKSHAHADDFAISNAGNHSHGVHHSGSGSGINVRTAQNRSLGAYNENPELMRTSSSGAHNHNLTGNIKNTGGNETRPVNYGVNYIIKL